MVESYKIEYIALIKNFEGKSDWIKRKQYSVTNMVKKLNLV
jgi:hypothetical protein